VLSEKVKNCLSNEYFLKEARIGDIFSWSEVSEIHKMRHGIYQQNERLISLLPISVESTSAIQIFMATTKTQFFTPARADAATKNLTHLTGQCLARLNQNTPFRFSINNRSDAGSFSAFGRLLKVNIFMTKCRKE
jgi:hypothetical protein